jgi:uncharacterized protein
MPPRKEALVEETTIARPRVEVSKGVRPLYLVAGLLCVGLGYVGVVVPGMPSTVFFLVALWAFKRSSPRFESWLLNHPVFGPTLRDWEETRSIRMGTKILAIAVIWVSIGVSIFLVHKPVVRGILLVTAVLLTAFLATRKTKV